MRYHSRDLSIGAEFHVLGNFGAILIGVIHDHARNAARHVQRFESQIRIRLQSNLEIVSHGILSVHEPSGVFQQTSRGWRGQHDVLRVMGHDRIQIVRIPRLAPFFGELLSIFRIQHEKHSIGSLSEASTATAIPATHAVAHVCAIDSSTYLYPGLTILYALDRVVHD